jgi:hypothetical protein
MGRAKRIRRQKSGPSVNEIFLAGFMIHLISSGDILAPSKNKVNGNIRLIWKKTNK